MSIVSNLDLPSPLASTPNTSLRKAIITTEEKQLGGVGEEHWQKIE
jgi:hypothetical protein